MFSSTRTQTWLPALVILAVAIPARAADVNKYLPDDTDFVLVLNVKQILGSPLIQKHALDELKAMIKGNSEASKHLEALGFDPFKDLNTVTTAFTISKGEPKGLLIAQGSFDVAKFEHQAEDLTKEKPNTLKISKEGKHKIYELKTDQQPAYICIVEPQTIVASNDKQYVLDAVGKAAGKQANIKREVRDLIEKADVNQSLWFGVTGSSLLNSDGANNPDAKKIFEKLDSVKGSIALNRDAKMVIEFATKGADAAKELSEILRGYLDQAKGLLAALAGDKKELAAAVAFIDAMKVETAGNSVLLKAEASEDKIEKSLKKN
jgi:hypothetical protein